LGDFVVEETNRFSRVLGDFFLGGGDFADFFGEVKNQAVQQISRRQARTMQVLK